MEQQERMEAYSSTVPTGVPLPYNDSGLLIQIVNVVMEGMDDTITQTTPLTQVSWSTPGIVATMDDMVLLVWLVKSMQEMGCQPYLGEQDAKIAGR